MFGFLKKKQVHIVSGRTVFGINDRVVVPSGITAVRTNVADSGCLLIESGGTAVETSVSGGGRIIVSEGGTAVETSVSGGGRIIVSGGTAAKTTIATGGVLFVESGGTVTDLETEKKVFLNFGITPDTCIRGTSDGKPIDIKNGYVSGMEQHYGTIDVSSGCTAVKTNCIPTSPYSIIWLTSFNVSSGGTAIGTIVSEGGIGVFRGGTATDFEMRENTHFIFVVAPDTYIRGTSDGKPIDIKNGYVSGFELHQTFEDLIIESGGTAVGTTVSKGQLTIKSGGTAVGTTVSSGSIVVSSGGTAVGTTVSSGSIVVSSGGTAADFEMDKEASFHFVLAPGTYVRGTSDGSSVDVRNGYVSGLRIISGQLTIESGGTAEDTSLDRNAFLTVSSGGTAINPRAENIGDHVTIFSNGVELSKDDRYCSEIHLEQGAVVIFTKDTNEDAGIASPDSATDATT